MTHIAAHITELIGNTPLLELSHFEEKYALQAHIIGKLEYMNPLGSVKDRVALAMIDEGIRQGLINADTVLIEPTSGNTGIGLAMAAAVKKLHLILTMPDTMSVERRKIVSALGAEIVLTPGAEGMQGSIYKADSNVSMAMPLFRSNLKTRRIQPSIAKRQLKKSGVIQMAR